MRVAKQHNVRLNEILDISENLFATKSFANTTINDILTGVGIDEGVYHTPYPQESFELVFAAAQFLLDPGLFKWTDEELQKRIEAFIYCIEIVLGTERGCFDFSLSRTLRILLCRID